jgi:hypothetical protein
MEKFYKTFIGKVSNTLKCVVFWGGIMSSGNGNAQTISSLEMGTTNFTTNTNGSTTFTMKDVNVTGLPIVSLSASQQGQAGGIGYVSSKNWNTTVQNTNNYWSFSISAVSGYILNISSVVIRGQRSSTGPTDAALRSSTDGYSSNLAIQSGLQNNSNVIAFTGLTLTNLTTVTFRIYGWATGNGAAGGTWRIGDGNNASLDIDIQGTVTSPGVILAVSGANTNHGNVCTNASAAAVQYVVTNNGNLQADGVTVESSDPQFVVSGLSSTTIPASGGTATYNVTFTPVSAGPKTSTISITSTTPGSNSPTSILTGTGIAGVIQTVTTTAATAAIGTNASLNGNVTTLGVCPSTNEKGFVYSLESTNADPFVGGAGVIKTSVAGIASGTYSQPVTGLTAAANYVYKAYVYDGTTYSYGSGTNFATVSAAPSITPAVTATVDAPFSISFIDDASWRGAISGITVGGNTLPGVSYSISSGSITFAPSTSGYLQTSGSLSIIISAFGFADANVTQVVSPGIPASIIVSTQPAGPSINGGTLATQPTLLVRDQYNNAVSSGRVINASVTSGQTSFWALGGNLTAITNGSGIAMFTNLTASNQTAANCTASLTFTSAVGSGTVNSNTFTITVGSLATDYFKSRVPAGNWSATSSWESSHDNTSWVNSTQAPTSSARAITIKTGQTITLTGAASAKLLKVEAGATLTSTNSSLGGFQLTIVDDGSATTDFDIFGTYILFGNAPVFAGGATGVVYDGAIVRADNNYNGESDDFAFSTSNSTFKTGSIFEWNTLNPFETSPATYFKAGSEIPIFRLTQMNVPLGGGSAFVINGIFEINTDFSFVGSGAKIFRDGIQGTGATLTLPSSIGTVSITGSNPILGGSGFQLSTDKIVNLSSGITVPGGATVRVTSTNSSYFQKGTGGIFLINGTLDITNVSISNTSGSVAINGVLKTSHTGGLEGGTVSTTSSVVNVNTGSTIEYNAASGSQMVSGTGILEGTSPYYNITFSGGGTKTLSNSVDVSTDGTVKITGTVTVDATNNNLGLTSANWTNFIMDGGRLILGTGGPQPNMDGTYTLTGGVIEYATGSASKTIRSGKQWQNIEVTGNNVGNSSGNITLKDLGTFKVKNGGVFTINDNTITGPTGTQTITIENGGLFKTGNNEGFHGFAATFSNNSSLHDNIENIILSIGCTVEYSRAGDQPITNSSNLIYQNVTISGTGNKVAPPSTLIIQGNLTKSGTSTFLHNDQTVLFNGTATQNYISNAAMSFYNIANNNTLGLDIQDSLVLVKELSLGANAKLYLSTGNFTLRSDAGRTANVSSIPSTAAITYGSMGRFLVERYIPSGINHGSTWQFLSTPASGSTIKNSWQEDGGVVSGYGTRITDPTAPGNGFDDYTVRGSMKYFSEADPSGWLNITTTNQSLANPLGYMLFVRGGRTVGVYDNAAATTLRTKGKLYAPGESGANLAPSLTIAANSADGPGFQSVGNPYASAISFASLRSASANIDDLIYLWDPVLGGAQGVGGYQTISPITGYLPTVPTISYPAGVEVHNIQSGQAFFVTNSTSSAGSINFNENIKISGSQLVNFTGGPGAGENSFAPGGRSIFWARLYNADGRITDGNAVAFDRVFSNEVKKEDANKMWNSGENFGIFKNDHVLAVEGRLPVQKADTIQYYLHNARTGSYQLRFFPENMTARNLKAVLVDRFNNSRTDVSLTDTSFVNIDFGTDPLSRSADRFYVVFEARHTVATKDPVQLTSGEPSIVVYPNPVENKQVNLTLTGFVPGRYTFELQNSSGLRVYNNLVQLTNDNNTRHIKLPAHLASGNYQLFVMDNNGRKTAVIVTIL